MNQPVLHLYHTTYLHRTLAQHFLDIYFKLFNSSVNIPVDQELHEKTAFHF